MLLNEVLQSGLKAHIGKKQGRLNRESAFELDEGRVVWAQVAYFWLVQTEIPGRE